MALSAPVPIDKFYEEYIAIFSQKKEWTFSNTLLSAYRLKVTTLSRVRLIFTVGLEHSVF